MVKKNHSTDNVKMEINCKIKILNERIARVARCQLNLYLGDDLKIEKISYQ